MNEDRIYQLLLAEQSSTINADDEGDLAQLRATHSKDVLSMEILIHATNSLTHPTTTEIDAGWDRVINEISIEGETATKVRPKRRLALTILGIAATLLAFAAIVFLLPPATQTLTTETDIKEFDLTDGSEIIANKTSRAIVQADYGKQSRNLTISGEVYIDAVTNAIPMQITSDQFQVNVLGTRFNILDYPSDHVSSVTLYEGSIDLTIPNGQKISMKPGDHVCWNKDKKSVQKLTSKLTRPAWIAGRLVFEDALFDEVLDRLERQHGVSFTGRELLRGLHFNYEAPNNSLADILAEIEVASGLHIEQLGGNNYSIKTKG